MQKVLLWGGWLRGPKALEEVSWGEHQTLGSGTIRGSITDRHTFSHKTHLEGRVCVCVLEHLRPLLCQCERGHQNPWAGVPWEIASRGMGMQAWVTQGTNADLMAWPTWSPLHSHFYRPDCLASLSHTFPFPLAHFSPAATPLPWPRSMVLTSVPV